MDICFLNNLHNKKHIYSHITPETSVFLECNNLYNKLYTFYSELEIQLS